MTSGAIWLTKSWRSSSLVLVLIPHQIGAGAKCSITRAGQNNNGNAIVPTGIFERRPISSNTVRLMAFNTSGLLKVIVAR